MAKINLGKVVPKKGVDYYTEQEKTQMEGEVKELVKEDLDFEDTIQGINNNIQQNTADIDTIKQKNAEQDEEIGKKAGKNEIPDVSDFITRLVNDLEYYYKKTETFTQQEIIQKISEEIAKIIADAPTSFDTLKEIADWISTHQSDASAMNSAIQTNAQDIANIKADYIKSTDYATALVAGVLKIAGYGLQLNNLGVLMGVVNTIEEYDSAGETRIISKGTLENVIAGKGLVKDTDYATNNKAGVFKTAFGVQVNNNGQINAGIVSLENYKNVSGNLFIGKGTLDNVLTQYSKTVELTQAQYDALETKDENTLYIIKEA